MNKRYIDFVPTAKKTVAATSKNTVTVKMPTPSRKSATSGVRRVDAVRRVRSTAKVKRVESVRRVAPKAEKRQTGVAARARQAEPVRQGRLAARAKQAAPVAKAKRVEPTVEKHTVTVRRAKPTRAKAATFTDEKRTRLGEVEDLNRHFVKTEVAKRPLSQPALQPKRSLREKISGKQAKASKKTTPEVAPEERLKETYRMPNSPFINQSPIEKRPLSKTVYTKKVVVPKEKKQEPVTIISKPEKQSHVGIVVAVILTIILGAAAGTVAFLLLPK